MAATGTPRLVLWTVTLAGGGGGVLPSKGTAGWAKNGLRHKRGYQQTEGQSAEGQRTSSKCLDDAAAAATHEFQHTHLVVRWQSHLQVRLGVPAGRCLWGWGVVRMRWVGLGAAGSLQAEATGSQTAEATTEQGSQAAAGQTWGNREVEVSVWGNQGAAGQR